MAMKVVRQARLELSGGSTPDQLRPKAAKLLFVGGSMAVVCAQIASAVFHSLQVKSGKFCKTFFDIIFGDQLMTLSYS